MKRVARWFLAAVCLVSVVSVARAAERPNFIIIFADDQGYGDLGCYGSPNIDTPHLDQMAAEGIRFTSFYAAPFCGPSRAALLTGCYPPRLSLAFNHGPKASTGIHANEITLPELLKKQGYATMHIGKWHLGDAPPFLPTRHGFDQYFGLPFSNDMWPYHPKMPPRENEDARMKAARQRAAYTGFAGEGTFYPAGRGFPHPLPLMSDEKVIETNPDQTQLTTRYTEKALRFIDDHQQQPFFLYLAHAMPHVPLFVSDKFAGKSPRGLYGDVMMEVDWSAGQILAHLKKRNLDGKTLVIYTSDNGPWLQYGIDGGSAGPLRLGKGTSYEGGMRVPTIMRWPGKIPHGNRSDEIAANMDLLPTLAALAGAALPDDRVIDGRNLWPLMSGVAGARGHQAFYYFGGSGRSRKPNLRAVRSGQWKLHLARESNRFRGTELYDLYGDVSESRNRLADHPDIANKLAAQAETFYTKLNKNVRPLGKLEP